MTQPSTFRQRKWFVLRALSGNHDHCTDHVHLPNRKRHGHGGLHPLLADLNCRLERSTSSARNSHKLAGLFIETFPANTGTCRDKNRCMQSPHPNHTWAFGLDDHRVCPCQGCQQKPQHPPPPRPASRPRIAHNELRSGTTHSSAWVWNNHVTVRRRSPCVFFLRARVRRINRGSH